MLFGAVFVRHDFVLFRAIGAQGHRPQGPKIRRDSPAHGTLEVGTNDEGDGRRKKEGKKYNDNQTSLLPFG